MRKLKIVILLLIIIAGVIILTGCGNYDHFDTNYTYTKAITYLGNERIEIDIKQWKDYEGEQIQIIGQDGKIYLVSSFNTILIKEWLNIKG